MLAPITRRPWTCSSCLRRQQQRIAKRCLVTSANTQGAAAAAAPAVPDDNHLRRPISKAAPSLRHDDRTLRQIFDSAPFWRDFSSPTKHPHSNRNAGLFQNRYLTRPEGFQDFASVTLHKCHRIVDKVLAYETTDDLKRVAKDLDRLSDLLCRVIDLSDFVRSVHPDRKVQMAATQAYAMMFEYMNVLNTTTGLNSQLKKAMSIPEIYNFWSEQEQTVAAILAKDFAKSAIDLSETDRQAFVDISNEVAEVGNEFVEKMGAEKCTLVFKESSRLKGMDPTVVRQLTRWGSVTLPTVGMPAMLALRTVEDAETRREIYLANRTSSQENIQRLEQLLSRRADLAKLSGYESFAHLTLSDKMAKTPEAVTSFLDALARDNAPQVRTETLELLELKQSDARIGNYPADLNAWDRDYYTSQLIANQRSKSRAPDFLAAYFSLGTVMQGLSRLFHRLYGIRLVPREPQPGETWNPDVRRLDVMDDHEGHIAVIYCDLFERAGKSPNPAHFTLRCSRRIEDEELREAAELPTTHQIPFATPAEAANDGLATAANPSDNNSLYQLPTIALICDFPLPPPQTTRPTLLSLRDLTTLFHEMGHALHSLCGRTALQNIAGTRCATDFAELPSVLMENFASAPEVLALYARHWETDAPLDPTRVQERVKLERRGHVGAEVESQVILGVLDQRLHSSAPAASEGFRGVSTKVYQEVMAAYSSTREPAETSWQGFFGHLVGYGGTYYSYLFDRAIAGKVWREVFRGEVGGEGSGGGAVDPAAGARFREAVLRHGGGRDGWACVAGALGGEAGERVREGGRRGMEEVGRWGVQD
ncbi:hypothetical protein B0A50_01433 [Salinomyces thailandicus]|uniref:Mitochondrial intermediate peptidase n=1 Tax=Salinomyces thailandicus TaxID=706561 RepID=A0A4U0UCY3_9PEZI|nr:hypothetical protein B0A50_01433 [Salinomyces thailandica]